MSDDESNDRESDSEWGDKVQPVEELQGKELVDAVVDAVKKINASRKNAPAAGSMRAAMATRSKSLNGVEKVKNPYENKGFPRDYANALHEYSNAAFTAPGDTKVRMPQILVDIIPNEYAYLKPAETVVLVPDDVMARIRTGIAEYGGVDVKTIPYMKWAIVGSALLPEKKRINKLTKDVGAALARGDEEEHKRLNAELEKFISDTVAALAPKIVPPRVKKEKIQTASEKELVPDDVMARIRTGIAEYGGVDVKTIPHVKWAIVGSALLPEKKRINKLVKDVDAALARGDEEEHKRLNAELDKFISDTVAELAPKIVPPKVKKEKIQSMRPGVFNETRTMLGSLIDARGRSAAGKQQGGGNSEKKGEGDGNFEKKGEGDGNFEKKGEGDGNFEKKGEGGGNSEKRGEGADQLSSEQKSRVPSPSSKPAQENTSTTQQEVTKPPPLVPPRPRQSAQGGAAASKSAAQKQQQPVVEVAQPHEVKTTASEKAEPPNMRDVLSAITSGNASSTNSPTPPTVVGNLRSAIGGTSSNASKSDTTLPSPNAGGVQAEQNGERGGDDRIDRPPTLTAERQLNVQQRRIDTDSYNIDALATVMQDLSAKTTRLEQRANEADIAMSRLGGDVDALRAQIESVLRALPSLQQTTSLPLPPPPPPPTPPTTEVENGAPPPALPIPEQAPYPVTYPGMQFRRWYNQPTKY